MVESNYERPRRRRVTEAESESAPLVVACVSGSTTDELLHRARRDAEGADVVELRVDSVPSRSLDLERLRGELDGPLIVTCRSASEGGSYPGSERDRRAILETAVRLRFDFVDFELASAEAYPLEGLAAGGEGASSRRPRLILSVHDFEGVPAAPRALVEKAVALGADVVKLAARVRSLGEAMRLAECARTAQKSGRDFVSVPMGANGASARILGGRLGSCLLYASARGGEPTGEGQLGLDEMLERYRVRSLSRKTAIYGIVGCRAMDSLSPAMHNDFFRRIGADAVYVPFQEDDLAGFVEAARALGVSGLSVTHPFKEEILEHLSEVEKTASRIGAVNTVVAKGREWRGFNTDRLGVLAPLRRLTRLEGLRVVVVGAGGAARAAAHALAGEGARVRVVARREEQARALAAAVGGEWGRLDEVAREEWDVLVNATPVGSLGADVHRLPLPASRIQRDSIVFDMVTVPAETPLLADARRAGARVVTGVSMLAAQAVEQARLWTGVAPSVEEMEASAKRGLGLGAVSQRSRGPTPASSRSGTRFTRPALGLGAPSAGVGRSPARYSRQVLFKEIGEEGQRRIRESSVLVVGVGAVGSVAAEMMSRAGVAHLRVVDRDYVDETNLQRQSLFDESDWKEGLPKAVAAERKLSRMNRDVSVEGRVEDVHAGNVLALFRGVDLVLDGTDNFGTRYLLNDASIQTGVPWIYAACVASYGMSFTILPGRGPCLRCYLEEEPPPGTSATCDTAGVIAPVVHAVAALEVAEALKILAGREDALVGAVASVDVWSGRCDRFRGVKRRPQCPACGLGRWDYLTGDAASQTVTLCGRNAVQVRPATSHDMQLDRVAERLHELGEVRVNAYLLRARVGDREIVLFRDGRAIVHGTEDPAEARSLYARYVGS